MVRVAGLRRQAAAGVVAAAARRTRRPRALDAIHAEVSRLCSLQRRVPRRSARRAERARRAPARREDLTPSEWGEIDEYFESQVFPVLTPLAVDPGHPFPYISNLSLSLAVEIRDPERGGVHFARVKVPKAFRAGCP